MELKGRRVATYARYSTDRQNPRSIEDQVRVCREFIERNGGKLSDHLVFSDAAISGTSTIRPGFQALFEAVRTGTVDVVITEDLSRIGRDVGNNDRILKSFRTWGARLLAINDGIDTGQPHAKLVTALKSAMAESYLDELRERTRRGLDGVFAAGMTTGGRTYGYRTVAAGDGTDRKRMVIDEAEADVVRRIFDLHVQGDGMRVIAERLNRDGVLSARGGKWQHLTLRSMLRNEIYAGVVIYNRKRWERDNETGKRRWVERPRSEWKRAEREELRIIDAETWAAAQDRIRHVERIYRADERPKRGFPLSGLLHCDQCGRLMSISNHSYYQCSGHKKGYGCSNATSLREPAIRAWVMDKIRDTAGADDLLDEMRAAWASSLGNRDREIKAELTQRRATLTRTEARISRLLDWVADGNNSPSAQAKIREQEDHAELQRAAITKLRSELGKVPTIPSITQMREFLGRVRDAVMLRPEEARVLLSTIVVGAIRCTPIAGGDYQIRFQLDPTVLLNATNASPSGLAFARGSCGGRI